MNTHINRASELHLPSDERRQLCRLMHGESIEAERKTVLFVTHDIDQSVVKASRTVVMSARPGRIKLDRPVDLPHPRHYSMKTTPAFAALKEALTECVRAEVLAAQRAQQQR
jgi:ABC-type nitrate/sulfonate/bicarbonate transport system ATPase subunit